MEHILLQHLRDVRPNAFVEVPIISTQRLQPLNVEWEVDQVLLYPHIRDVSRALPEELLDLGFLRSHLQRKVVGQHDLVRELPLLQRATLRAIAYIL